MKRMTIQIIIDIARDFNYNDNGKIVFLINNMMKNMDND